MPYQGLIRQHPLRDQVRRQRFIPLMFAINHHRLFHLRVRGQRAFDFSQLNAVAADLDLKIITPQVFQIAVRPPAHQIAGFIQTGIAPRLIFCRGKRVHHKILRGQLRPVPIPAGHTGAPDVKLTGRTEGGQVTPTFTHIQAGVINRPADGHIAIKFAGGIKIGDFNRRFRWPVEVN